MAFGGLGSRDFARMGAMGAHSWVINPSNKPDVYLNFSTNRSYKAGAIASAASLLTVTRASTGYVNDSSGNWTSVANNLPRISNLGLLVEESRANGLLNNSMQGAEATDNVELLTNATFPTDLSGWTVTNTGASSVVWASAQHVTYTYDGSNATRLDQAFTAVIGHRYTVRVAFNSITTMGIGVDIGSTTPGSFDYVNGSTATAGPCYYTFIATTTTVNVRVRAKGSAGSASLAGISGMIGGIPTGWVLGASGTVQDVNMFHRVVGVGVDSTGLEYVRCRYFGTTGTGTGTLSFHFCGGADVPASNAAIWTGSVFNRLVAGSTTGLSSLGLFPFATAGSGVALSGTSAGTLTLAAGWTRDTRTQTLNNASTTDIVLSMEHNSLANSSIDMTYDLAWPQLELGSSVTSPIRTTTVALTRAADVIKLTTAPTFGSAYSFYVNGTPQSPNAYGTAQHIFDLNDGGTQNSVRILRSNATPTYTAGLVSAGSFITGAGLSNGTWNQNAVSKIAYSASAGTQSGYYTSGTAFSPQGTGASLPTIATPTVTLGARGGAGDRFFNGFIAEAAIWSSQQVPNAQLQSMTS